MPISFNTGTTVSNGVGIASSQAITIPAGVLAGDVIIVVFTVFRVGANETLQASSTGTAPAIVGSTQNATAGGSTASSAVFSVVATASDAGKVITGSTVSADTGNWAAALGAWTGARSVTPVDVNAGTNNAGPSSTITCPSAVTGAANDWDLQIVGAALAGATFSGGAGFTQREAVVDASSGCAGLIYDSNSSVGPAGTTIGGAAFSNAGHNNWWNAFTIGLAPPAALAVAIQPAGGRSMLRKSLEWADL